MQSRIRTIPTSYQNPEKSCSILEPSKRKQWPHIPPQSPHLQRDEPREEAPQPEQSLCSQTQTDLTEPEDRNVFRPKQMLKKQKESTKKQRKLEWYLALNREYTVTEYLATVTDPKLRTSLTMYRLSEHSLAIEKGCRRQTWLSREDRLCAHFPQNEVKMHFLTSCQMYDHIRDTYFHQITQINKEFENKPKFDKLPYLLGEIPQCAITAARCVT